MENSKKLKAKTIVVTALPPKEGKSYYKIVRENDIFLITEIVFKFCEEGLLDEVEFEPNGQFTTTATEDNPAKTFNSWKAVNFTESQLALNKKKAKLLESQTNLELAIVDSELKVKFKRQEYESKFKELYLSRLWWYKFKRQEYESKFKDLMMKAHENQ
jgi:hypothetical protein